MSASRPVWVVPCERLELRPVLADASPDALASLTARTDGVPVTAERFEHAKLTIERSARAFAAHGYGLWWIVLVGAAEPAGWCGLKDGDDPAQPELMYGLVPEARRQGLAAEAVRGAVAYAMARPTVVRVWGATRPENDASARVMQRAGLAPEGFRTLDGRAYLVFGTAPRPTTA